MPTGAPRPRPTSSAAAPGSGGAGRDDAPPVAHVDIPCSIAAAGWNGRSSCRLRRISAPAVPRRARRATVRRGARAASGFPHDTRPWPFPGRARPPSADIRAPYRSSSPSGIALGDIGPGKVEPPGSVRLSCSLPASVALRPPQIAGPGHSSSPPATVPLRPPQIAGPGHEERALDRRRRQFRRRLVRAECLVGPVQPSQQVGAGRVQQVACSRWYPSSEPPATIPSTIARPAAAPPASATATARVGWQQVNMSRRRSSTSRVSLPIITALSRLPSATDRSSSDSTPARRAVRRIRTSARLRATVVGDAPGFDGTPSRRHVSSAVRKASAGSAWPGPGPIPSGRCGRPVP